MTTQKTILITGASSGIGQAVALLYAAPHTTLLLTGRSAERLRNIADSCAQKGATVKTSTVSVADRFPFEKQILAWDDQHPIDTVIANAGISGGIGKGTSQSEQQFRDIMSINLDGTFNTVNPLIPRMITRKKGHIVLMSSMAGFRGLPTAPAYSVSKVAVRAYGDALRPLLKNKGITVTTIFPGFVKTPLTDVNTFRMPWLMDVNKAADIIKRGLDAQKLFIAFPWQMHILSWLLGAMPRCLGDKVAGYMPEKN